MIASQTFDKDAITEVLSTECRPSDVYNRNMGEISGLEDKNGNLELVKDNVTVSNVPDKVCRTCLSLVEPESCLLIRSVDSDARIQNMLITCLPQLNLLLTNDPVVCQKCFTKLEDFYSFFINCNDTESKLVNYCTTNHITTPINLCDVLKKKLNEPVEMFNVKLENDDNPNDVAPAEIEDIDTYSNDGDADVKNEDEPFAPDESSNTDTENEKKPLKRRKRIVVRKRCRTKPKQNENLFSDDLAEAIVKCETCNKKFPSKWALDRHTPVHSEEKKFICETCNMSFRYKHSFQKHLLAHLNGAPVTKPFACECGKYFNRKAKLKKHQQIHIKKDRPFGCEHCGKRFIDQDSLSSHVIRVHATEKPFSCEICGNKYSSKSGLDVHFKTHFPSDKPRPEPDLMCDFCGKLFYRKYSLEKHRMSHTGDKPHECEQCGMKFKERYQLTIHNRRHTGEKPFDCEICGFKFPSKNRLGVHMRIHTGVRPFPCQMCDMAFTRKDHLIKHVRAIHTGERPFECDICLKTFNRRDYMIKHKKVHVKRGL